ncbi:MAG: hypothetical protein AAB921_01485, partial [Patescibacteria group bacterium]
MLNLRIVLVSALLVLVLLPNATHAATKLEFSGWLPYWRVASSTRDVMPHLNQLTEVNPFGYTVKKDGSLNDAAKVSAPEWQALFKAARAQKVR